MCLVGDPGVGKTTLLRRLARTASGDEARQRRVCLRRYALAVPARDLSVELVLRIRDVGSPAGPDSPRYRRSLRGARAVVGVASCTDPTTVQSLDDWIHAALEAAGDVPVIYALNQVDRADRAALTEAHATLWAYAFGAPCTFVSAKTGENVTALLDSTALALTRRILQGEDVTKRLSTAHSPF